MTELALVLTKDELQAAVDGLGKTATSVATALENAGATGFRFSAYASPVANYLASIFPGVAFSVGFDYMGSRDGKVMMRTSEGVQEFFRAFDRKLKLSAFPELRDPEDNHDRPDRPGVGIDQKR